MGQIASRNRRRGFLAVAALLSIALAACSGPTPPAPSPSAASPSVQQPSTAPSSSSTSAVPDVSASAAPSGESSTDAGGLGRFGSISEACAAVSATVLSVLALPMAAAIGKDTADVEKAKEALAKMQGQVPPELKEPVDKLKSMADNAGQDFSKFDTEEFDKAIAPIDAWLQAHC